MVFEQLRLDVIRIGIEMLEKGLTIGTGGNISARCPDGENFLITPSGMPYNLLKPEDIVMVNLATGATEGIRKPSIELHLHWKTLVTRPDVGGVVHVHSPIASALAAAHRPLPVILDVCAFNFKGQVEVADYGMSGSEQLADNVVRALGQRNAVLMSNHGSLAVGKDVKVALDRCELLEKASYAYLLSQSVGGAVALSDDTVAALLGGIGKTYGQQPVQGGTK